MNQPTFLICGAQKAGTTALWYYLNQHPEIYMAPDKEINYFSLNYDQGREWYLSHFRDSKKETAIGEASPLYIWLPDCCSRIHKDFSNIKLIFILRNPVERAWSNYWYNIQRNVQNPHESFDTAVRTEDGQERYISKGLYYQQLLKYYELFSPKQMLVLLHEDLKHHRTDTLRDVFRFLDVSTDAAIHDHSPRNVTAVPRNRFAIYFLSIYLNAKKFGKKYAPEWSRDTLIRMRNVLLPRIQSKLLSTSDPKPEIAPETRDWLCDTFKEDISQLSQLIGRDLSSWQRF
jgi:hypothetical protein